jgi:preprotein translocase subunit SecD
MKRSFIAVLTGIVFSTLLATASAGPILQLRLASETALDDAERMTYVTHNDGHTNIIVLYVQKAVLLDESMLKSAFATKDVLGQQMIDLTFNTAGTEQFAKITSENVGKQLAIIIDGKIYQAPVIRMGISSGMAAISGSFSKAETQDLVKKLNEAAGKK